MAFTINKAPERPRTRPDSNFEVAQVSLLKSAPLFSASLAQLFSKFVVLGRGLAYICDGFPAVGFSLQRMSL